jgi:Ni/Co efflux regulator RcnB
MNLGRKAHAFCNATIFLLIFKNIDSMNKLLLSLLSATVLGLPLTSVAQAPAAPATQAAQPEQAAAPSVTNTDSAATTKKAKKAKKKKLKKKKAKKAKAH